MQGGSVYKDHTFNKETHISRKQHNTKQVHEQPHYNNKYINISTIQVHEHYKIQQKHRKYGRKQEIDEFLIYTTTLFQLQRLCGVSETRR
jgi:hypothetical protein